VSWQESIARRERRLARYEQVVDLHRQGLSIRAIASQLQISPKTATRLLRAGTFTVSTWSADPPREG
jgi:DNA-binding NarL/FixJ family response regulator